MFFFQAEDGIRDGHVTGVQTCALPIVKKYTQQLRGRSMMVARGEMFPVECVVRGYLSGSGWKEYKSTGKVCGIALPAGLRESDQLPEPIFTPEIGRASCRERVDVWEG